MDDIAQTIEEIATGLESFKNKNNKRLEELEENINIVKDGSGGTSFRRGKTLGQQAVELLKEAGLNSQLQKGSRKTIVLKVAGTMTTGNVDGVGTNSIPYSLASTEAGLTRIVRRKPWIIELANTSTTNKMYVQWSEQENPDGAAGETAEGQTKNLIDFDWVEKSKKVEKVTAYIKVSKEALDDLDGLANDIDNELRETVMLAVDSALLDGDGTTPTLDGILNQATAWAAGVFAGTVSDANYFDVLRTGIAQVTGENFNPTAIVLHPDDVATMDLAKASDGHYVLPPFKSDGGTIISGVRVVENTGVDQGDFLIGDFSKLNIRVREGFTIDVGYEGEDFIKNLVTILGEIRLASYIKGVHRKAFVYGDFETAVSALESGS